MTNFHEIKLTTLNSHQSKWWPITLAGFLILGVVLTGCKDEKPSSQEQAEATAPAAHSHASAGETCFICDSSKRDKGRLWCKEHARYEDRCWICQPQLRDEKRPYCEEHSLYEDECILCDPSRSSSGEKPQL